MELLVQTDFNKLFDKLKCCVIVPTYNNARTLCHVLDGIVKYTSNVIVINDGSTDKTGEILKSYQQIEIITFKKNKGKGSALKKGFSRAYELGYQHGITIDSDGQHMPDDLPNFIKKLEEEPGSMIIGARNMKQEGIPGKSSFGNRFSNFWFKVETGISLPDTQSGYRLYPLKDIHNIRLLTPKFEFEIEIMVRAAWKGISVIHLPVDVYYPPEEERVSHFRPFKDFTRISILNTFLVLLALLYYRPVMYFRNFSLKKAKEILGSGESTLKLATATGFGLFMGIVPIWGYQMIVAAFLAHFLRLNKALVLVASNISIPPMIPFILYGSFRLGKGFVHTPVNISFTSQLNLEFIKSGVVQYLAGSILLAILAGVFGFILAYYIIAIKRKNKRRVLNGQ